MCGRRTFLQQNHTCEPIVQVPKVNTADAAFVVQVAVDVKRLVGLDFHLTDSLAWDGAFACSFATSSSDTAGTALVQGRVELVGPWGSVAVAITVVVTQQVVSPGLFASLNRKGLVYRRQQVFRQVGRQSNDGVEVLARVFRVESTKQVSTHTQLVSYVLPRSPLVFRPSLQC